MSVAVHSWVRMSVNVLGTVCIRVGVNCKELKPKHAGHDVYRPNITLQWLLPSTPPNPPSRPIFMQYLRRDLGILALIRDLLLAACNTGPAGIRWQTSCSSTGSWRRSVGAARLRSASNGMDRVAHVRSWTSAAPHTHTFRSVFTTDIHRLDSGRAVIYESGPSRISSIPSK